MTTKDLIELTSGFLYTYLIMFTPQMFLESLWSCAPPPIVVSFLQWGVNFIKYVQRNPEVSSIKSFVGIQLHPNWLNACNLRFASNVGLSYNVFWSYQLNSTANSAHLVNRLNWQCCLAGGYKTAPKILIFSIAMGADYSFELIFIVHWLPQFIGHNKIFLGSVP